MGTIEQAVQVDIINFCLVALLIMAAVAAAVKIIEEFSKIIGRAVKWIKSNNTDHEQLVELKKEMSDHIQAIIENRKFNQNHLKIVSLIYFLFLSTFN